MFSRPTYVVYTANNLFILKVVVYPHFFFRKVFVYASLLPQISPLISSYIAEKRWKKVICED